MWILLLIVVTTTGEYIPYEQGIYYKWADCQSVKNAMLKELGNQYRATCVEWINE